jgi:diguanylate cyclase
LINDLFINILLLVSFTFIAAHILKDVSKDSMNSIYGKTLLGISGGIMGIFFMIYTIEVKGTTALLDLRVFAIMMVSYIGGTIPTIVSGIIIGIYRTVYLGINISSIIAVIQILLYIIFFYIVDKKIKIEWKKWFLKVLISLIILASSFAYLLRNVENFQTIILEFSLVIIFAGILEYYLLEYVRSSNELYRRYKKESTKDFLTGLYNTRQFDKILNVAFEKALENKENLSCLMIDIDHFKKVNDTYGHGIGDLVLKELAYILKKSCRIVDVVGRIGGEEFCVLLFDCPKDQVFEIAWGINRAVQNHEFFIGEDKFINITVSIGVAIYPDTTSNLEDIKEKADMALYKAKHSGRNKVCHNLDI